MGLVAAAFSTASALQSPSSKSGAWPPGLQQVSEESPALSPEAEAKTFFLPPGYHAELVASEPMVEDPILIDWDAERPHVGDRDDRLHAGSPATNERAPIGRISVLEDTNRDGKMDKKTVFLDGLVLPRALKVLDKGVLVGEPPHLWLAQRHQRRSQGRQRKIWCATATARSSATSSTTRTACCGRWTTGCTRRKGIPTSGYKDGKMETRKTLSRGQWGATQDDFGRVYRNSNSSALHIDLLSTPYFVRNPNLLRTRGSYEFMGDPDELNATYPVRPNQGVNRGYQTGQLRGDGTLATYTGVNSPMVYRGDRLPAELAGNVFIAEPTGNLDQPDHRQRRRDHIARARKRTRMPSSWPRPTSDSGPCICRRRLTAPSTSSDIYHGIIQEKGFITEYCAITSSRTSSRRRSTWGASGESCTTRRGATDPRHLDPNRPRSWSDALSHPNGWWRDTAQQLLIQRGDRSVVPALKKLAESATEPRTRLHALWTLDGLDRLDPATVDKALEDKSRDVRANAVRLSERFLAEPNAPVQAALLKHVDDRDWRCASSWPRRSARCRLAAARNRVDVTARTSWQTMPCSSTRRSADCAASEAVVLDQLAQVDRAVAHARNRDYDAERRRSCAVRRMPRCRRYCSTCRKQRAPRGSVRR